MPKVSARSFRLGLCPAPTQTRSSSSQVAAMASTPGHGSPQITPKRGLGAGSSGSLSDSSRDTPSDEMETVRAPIEVEEEEIDPKSRSHSGIWLVAGAITLVAAVIVAVVFWPGGTPPVAVVPVDPDGKANPKPTPQKPVAPGGIISLAEATNRVGEKVTVQYTVGSFGGKVNVYLNSSKDFTAKDNFAVLLTPKTQVGKWTKPTNEMFVGKTIRATGVIKLNKDIPQLELINPQDLEFVD